MQSSDLVQIVTLITAAIVALGTAYMTFVVSPQLKSNAIETKLTAMQTNITALETKEKVKEVHDVVNSNYSAMKTELTAMASQYEKVSLQYATLLEKFAVSEIALARSEGAAEGRTVSDGNGGQVPVLGPPSAIDASTLGPTTVINTENMSVDADTVSIDSKKKPKSSK